VQHEHVVPDGDLRNVRSEQTAVGGAMVYADGSFQEYDVPPLPSVLSAWSPVRAYGVYQYSS
jgi:hypothetical protein